MRCKYREKQIYSGDYLEVNIYPVFRKGGHRRKKYKPTSEVQQELNRKNSQQKLIRLLNTNFTADDLRFDLTYAPEYLPQSDDEALKNQQNFIRRLKRFRKNNGLPELKYVAVTEKSSKGRYHHHLVISGGVPLRDLAELWGKGYTDARPLQFNQYGIEGLARYLVKSPIGSKSYCASRNLQQPAERTVDGRISQRKMKELSMVANNAPEYEKLYEGYELVEAIPFWNDYNQYQYITVKMVKKRKKKRCF